nr:dynein axonemal intermediate chain 1-like [Parasteatoda tepidariorum]
MLDQNMSGSNLDFMYYECPKDEFKPNFGSLLPLWNLSNRETKRMLVSSLCWNNHYPDLFAVGFRDNGEQLVDEMEERGLVYVYSLKGPSFPERIVRCASGVCSVLFHTSLPQIVIVALTSGDLELYDLSKTPIAVRESKFGTHFHEDTLCEVQWLPDKLPQKLCSISKDGTIINWLIFMNNLIPDEVVANLSIKEWPLREPPKGLEMAVKPKHPLRDALPANSIGMSVSVNQQSASLFLASTVSGLIQEYTFEDKTCKTVFDEHSSSVRSVRWNPFHPDVFISCSNDFTVLVWEHTHKQPLFEFFFDRQLKDVSWAPFSSSLFAAISGNAVVSVFDLALNKVEAIGTYAVYTPKQNINLTKVLFHPTMPILIVGDEKGSVIILKLSPNIRSSLKDLNTEEFVSREREKMERLLKVSIRPAL